VTHELGGGGGGIVRDWREKTSAAGATSPLPLGEKKEKEKPYGKILFPAKSPSLRSLKRDKSERKLLRTGGKKAVLRREKGKGKIKRTLCADAYRMPPVQNEVLGRGARQKFFTTSKGNGFCQHTGGPLRKVMNHLRNMTLQRRDLLG